MGRRGLPSVELRELRRPAGAGGRRQQDQPAHLRPHSRILGHAGHTCGSGREALDILDSHPPFDLILLDYHMPEMDGIAVAQEIKSHPRFAPATILMLSSGGGPEEATRARQAGVAASLFKPFKQSELLAAVLKALGKALRKDERKYLNP